MFRPRVRMARRRGQPRQPPAPARHRRNPLACPANSNRARSSTDLPRRLGEALVISGVLHDQIAPTASIQNRASHAHVSKAERLWSEEGLGRDPVILSFVRTDPDGPDVPEFRTDPFTTGNLLGEKLRETAVRTTVLLLFLLVVGNDFNEKRSRNVALAHPHPRTASERGCVANQPQQPPPPDVPT